MKGNILVVDDEEIILNSCSKVLSPEGYAVDTAKSAADGLALFAGKAYDLVITDIRMPGMGGIQFIEGVRQKNKDVNIIVITGYPSQDNIKEALTYRILEYLPKPFSPVRLVEVVRNSLEIKTAPEQQADDYTEETAAGLDKIIEKYKNRPGGLIPALDEAQELVGYLPPIVQRHIANGMRVSISEVHGVVSFYSFFTMKPKGRHNIKVCLGTACYVKGAEEILKNLKNNVGLETGGITADRRFSLETVRCLGACGLAPVVTVGKDTLGSVSPLKIMDILKEYE